MHKRNGFALKLDMSKAYDWVELHFREHMLRCIGFLTNFYFLVMECAKIVSYFILANGNPIEYFKLERALRQRGPM